MTPFPLLPILLLANPTTLNPLHARTALRGRTPWLPDLFLLTLGMQQPLVPARLNEAEYPACAAMTTGYIFRVENQATVWYLQKVGRTGWLRTLNVELDSDSSSSSFMAGSGRVKFLFALIVPAMFLISLRAWREDGSLDFWLLVSLMLLFISRFLSILAIRRRTASQDADWHGASEPGVRGDLLILCSEDRWIRLRGAVDDLKAVTSGSWLPPTTSRLDGGLEAVSRMLVYLAVVVLSNATLRSQIVLIVFVGVSHVVVGWHNARADQQLRINGRKLQVVGEKQYDRRLVMAEELMNEVGGDVDWAVRIGLINPTQKKRYGAGEEVVTM